MRQRKENYKSKWKVNEKSKMLESPKLYNESVFKKEKNAKQFITELQDKKAIISELKKSKQKEFILIKKC